MNGRGEKKVSGTFCAEHPKGRSGKRFLTPFSPLALALLALAGAAACRSWPEQQAARRAELVKRIDQSLARAGKYLIARQSADGAWRSEVYGCFREGPELTGYVMSCLFFMPQAGEGARTAYRKGADYLASFVDEGGKLKADPPWLNFPVYSAVNASRAVVLLDKSERNLRAQRGWLDYVLARQLNAGLGWEERDPEFGGWGFSILPPRKPAAGAPRGPFCESNLSATVFGIAALRSAKLPPEHPAYRAALLFAKRCQNFADDPEKADRRFDDGGFFFMPGDPVQNKAGVAGVDQFGRRRFHSYGTMTADGLRVLVRCGLPPDHPRVVAARQWLESHFTATENPGRFEKDREVLRNATYYYWAWAVAHAFQAVGARQIVTSRGKFTVRWAEELAGEMLRRQHPDGSWTNRGVTDAKEDDPLVATPWAAAALAICRNDLAGGIERGDRGPMLTDLTTTLTPDPQKSFVTIVGTGFLVGLLGDGWALQAYVPCPLSAKDGGPVPGKVLAPRDCIFARGPDLEKNVRPPQGVPTLPVSMRTDCQTREVKDLKITVLRVEGRGEGGFVELELSGFTAGGEKFPGIPLIRLPNRGPYP